MKTDEGSTIREDEVGESEQITREKEQLPKLTCRPPDEVYRTQDVT